jgi:uncharacterized protein YjiS (DUF1127 family)
MSTLTAHFASRGRRTSPVVARCVAIAIGNFGQGLGARFAEWRRNARSRAELARFSRRELQDIGITPAETERECARPFWLS